MQTISLYKKGEEDQDEENIENERIEDIYMISELKNTEVSKNNEKSV